MRLSDTLNPTLLNDNEDDDDIETESESDAPPAGRVETTMETVMSLDWAPYYRACPVWGPPFLQTEASGDWPAGMTRKNDKLFLDRKLCVPMGLQLEIVKEVHESKGHPGREKLWRLLGDRLSFANRSEAKHMCSRVIRACGPCQVTRPPNFRIVY